jgi:hypothetical protein
MSKLARFIVPVMLALLSACGGGGGEATTLAVPTSVPPTVPAIPPPPPTRQTTVTLQSQTGDPIGLGRNSAYDKTNAKIELNVEHNRLVLRVEGDETWTGVFQTGGTEQAALTVGMVANAAHFVHQPDWSKNGLTWHGEGRFCSTSTGWFAIDSVSYSGATLTHIVLRFERFCNGAASSLRGEIKYFSDDTTKPLPPVMPVPATLWKPAVNLADSIGSYAYFESEEGDYVGLGKTYRYDRRTAKITLSGDNTNLGVNVVGHERWSLELRGMQSFVDKLPLGYYPGVQGSRFHNPVKGGFSWTGEGRGCRDSTGWFAIDAVTRDTNGTITAFDMRFEQHCEGRAAALRGVLHYVDPKIHELPQLSGNTPVGSWRAPAAALPASGNYFYLQGDLGDPLTQGLVDLQTSLTAVISARAKDNTLSFETSGTNKLRGDFIAKLGQAQFTPGNYTGMADYPNNAVGGGALVVYANGIAPTEPKGWIVIDSISYVGAQLAAVELRFEQLSSNRLGNSAGLLHGQLRWRAGEVDRFPGPTAAPALFWRPAAGTTPSVGNYVYMESDRSDFIGNQGSYLFTPLDSLMTLTGAGNTFTLNLRGDTVWSADFTAMSNLPQIQPGYYKGQPGGSSSVLGSFRFGGDARGCNEATSGVVVDKATYANGRLVELNMRFEQHCDNEPGALRGEIRWSASDLRNPLGPPPIPVSLWRAPLASLPTKGNYLYIESNGRPADNRTFLMDNTNTSFNVLHGAAINPEALFQLEMSSALHGTVSAAFQPMIGLQKFQVGFYDRVLHYPFHNRAFGGFSWAFNYSTCDVYGWYSVDQVTYIGDIMTGFHARFSQGCLDGPGTMRGELNWEASSAALMKTAMKRSEPASLEGQAWSLSERPERGGRVR